MAPMSNVPYILAYGILSYNEVKSHPDLINNSASIADPFVNNRRHRVVVGGKSLHDYVPLYWATHTPMQYVVTIKERRLDQRDLVFFVFEAKRVLAIPGVVTTDGNAASSETRFFNGKGAIEHLDWGILNTRNCYSREYKRRKCAEVLVPKKIPTSLIGAIVVYDEEAAERLFWTVEIASIVDGLFDPSNLMDSLRRLVIPKAVLYYA